MKFNRRDFITLAAVGAAGCATTPSTAATGGRIRFGICNGGKVSETPEMKDLGYDYFEGGVAGTLMPDKDEETWKRRRDELRSAALPIYSCNGFLPGTFRITGPNANWEPILDYAAIACRRADEVGVQRIVFGSGGARNVPAGFEGGRRSGYSIQAGRDQFAAFCGKLAERIADRKVVIVIEPLCPDESNIINYVWQGLQIVDEVKSPRIQQLADLYHMSAGREPAESIIKAGAHLQHCHVATPGTRQAPGLGPDGMLPEYFAALRKIGYTGGVSCECGWGPKGTDRRAARAKAISILRAWAGQ